MKTYLLAIIFFVLPYHVSAQFSSIDEFAKTWSPPFTSEEKKIFIPAKDEFAKKGFQQVQFAKDGTFRSLFCTKGTKLSGVGPDQQFHVTMGNGYRVPDGAYCRVKELVFSGQGIFNQKDFAPISIEYAERPAKLGGAYEVNGVKFTSGHVAFEGMDTVRKRLRKFGFTKGFLLRSNPGTDEKDDVEILFGAPVRIWGAQFPQATVAWLKAAQDQNGNTKDEFGSATLPSGEMVEIQGIWCEKEVDYSIVRSALRSCIIAKPFPLFDSKIPPGTKVYFFPDRAGHMNPRWVRNLSESMTVKGTLYNSGETLKITGDMISREVSTEELERLDSHD